MKSLCEVFSRTVALNPDAEALVFGDKRYTWQQLHDLVDKLAIGLGKKGIGKSDVVGLWLQASPCFIISYLAVLARGACVLPLNTSMKAGDLKPLQLNIKTLITSQNMLAGLQAIIDVAAVDVGQLLIAPNEALLNEWELLFDDLAKGDNGITVNADMPAIMMYSGGSTGVPKSLIRTHKQCVAEISQSQRTMGFNCSDVIYSALPLYHAHGMANALWAAIGCGAKLVLLPSTLPISLQLATIIHSLAVERVTVLPGVPFLFELLASWPKQQSFSDMRLCFCAGAALKPDTYTTLQRQLGLQVRQLYGCTEAGAVTINMEPITPRNVNSVGNTIADVQLQICSEDGEPLPIGEVGEIRFQSAALFSGYLDNNHNTACFHNGWFCSGDMGRMSANRSLEIVGRKEFVLNVAGYKFFANEVENLLEQHPAVKEAAVAAIEVQQGICAVAAYVVPFKKRDSECIMEFCRLHLPVYKCPQTVEFVQALPKTSLGKLQRNLLPSRD